MIFKVLDWWIRKPKMELRRINSISGDVGLSSMSHMKKHQMIYN